MRSPDTVSTPPENVIATSSGVTPATSTRITMSSPRAKMSVAGTHAVACVRSRSSIACP